MISGGPVELSVIVPCYQESERLLSSLQTIRAELDRGPYAGWEILVVDDGSTDGTADLVDGFDPRVTVIRFPRNRGKGAAVRTGMLQARGRLRLMTDADLATPITELNRLVAAMLAGADLAIGRRTGPYSRVHIHQPWYRQTMGKVFNLVGRLLFNVRYQDTQCGFKLFTGRAAEAIFRESRIDRFAFDFECILLARQLGLKIAECYVLWNHVEGSRVRLVADSASMFFSLIKLRLGLH
jgi:dolichyl-phosphate beta-glucosyltransferase